MSEQDTFISHLVELRDAADARAARGAGSCSSCCSSVPARGAIYDLLARAADARAARGREDDRHRRDHAVHGADEDHRAGGASCSRCPTCSTRRGRSSRPGLYEHEKKLALPLVVASTLLFLARRRVLLLLRVRHGVHLHQRASRRSRSRRRRTSRPTSASCITMFLAFGLTFEIPIVVIVLVRIGRGEHREAEGGAALLDRRRLRGRRGGDAARRALAVHARDADVPALRGRALRRPLHREAGGERDRKARRRRAMDASSTGPTPEQVHRVAGYCAAARCWRPAACRRSP